MRPLPELLNTFPENYRKINLISYREWIAQMILIVPKTLDISEIPNKKPPKLLNRRY